MSDGQQIFLQNFDYTEDCDQYGQAVGVWFDVAATLHNRGIEVPSEWQYVPAPTRGFQEVDEHSQSVFVFVSDADLIAMGNFLFSEANRLESEGKGY